MNPYPNCDVCARLTDTDSSTIILDTPYWLVCLRSNNQTMLGTSFVILKRHAHELDMLTREEDEAFIQIRNQLIAALRVAFNPITFNVSCLKNNAFREHPDTTPSEEGHVHWHFKPRYGTQPIEFAGEIFRDSEPGRYDKQIEMRVVDAKLASNITSAIRGALVEKAHNG